MKPEKNFLEYTGDRLLIRSKSWATVGWKLEELLGSGWHLSSFSPDFHFHEVWFNSEGFTCSGEPINMPVTFVQRILKLSGIETTYCKECRTPTLEKECPVCQN